MKMQHVWDRYGEEDTSTKVDLVDMLENEHETVFDLLQNSSMIDSPISVWNKEQGNKVFSHIHNCAVCLKFYNEMLAELESRKLNQSI